MTDKKPQGRAEEILASRRNFLRQSVMGAGAVAGATLAAPYVNAQTGPIKWRLQTYSGAPLGAHVIKPQIDAFNAAANGEMEIELYYADQLVPTADLFRALQNGTLDAVQSDEATMASPVDISCSAARLPFATRYSLDVPALFRYYGAEGNLKRPIPRWKASPGCRPGPGTRCISLPSTSRSAASPT